MSLNSLFSARTVAVVGASQTPGKTGNTIVKNIVQGGYTGELYPINPRGGEMFGKPVYENLSGIGKPVDLVVIAVPAPVVPGIISEARLMGAKSAVIITGGFGEIGNTELETRVLAEAKAGGIRVIGPNCQGFNYTPNSLCATWPLYTKKGSVAVISQSGTVGAALSGWAEDDGVGVSGFVGLGNKADVSELELLEFFGNDQSTKVIAMYLERVKDGAKFLSIAGEVVKKKPVVVLKGGRTPEGRTAAQSHTRSVAGKHEVFLAACRKAGLIPARDVVELYDFSKAAAFLPKAQGKRISILTSSGGCGILAVDACVDSGFGIPKPEEVVASRLKEVLPPQCVISNPLDLTGDATSSRYLDAANVLSAGDAVDLYLMIFGDPIPGARDVVSQVMNMTKKPVGVVYIGGGEVEKAEALKMQSDGIPVFPTPERGVRSLTAVLGESAKRNHVGGLR